MRDWIRLTFCEEGSIDQCVVKITLITILVGYFTDM